MKDWNWETMFTHIIGLCSTTVCNCRTAEHFLKQNSFKLSFESRSIRDVSDYSMQKVMQCARWGEAAYDVWQCQLYSVRYITTVC